MLIPTPLSVRTWYNLVVGINFLFSFIFLLESLTSTIFCPCGKMGKKIKLCYILLVLRAYMYLSKRYSFVPNVFSMTYACLLCLCLSKMLRVYFLFHLSCTWNLLIGYERTYYVSDIELFSWKICLKAI